jgi:hypothetical protein
MNTEQAYINGFVKRASEYGYSEDGAVQLAKEAMRGAAAANLAIGLKDKGLGEYAVRAGRVNIPGRGTPDAQRLAELLRKIKAHEKTLPIDSSFSFGRLNLKHLYNKNEALRMML